MVNQIIFILPPLLLEDSADRLWWEENKDNKFYVSNAYTYILSIPTIINIDIY